jgi:hypothetical protein
LFSAEFEDVRFKYKTRDKLLKAVKWSTTSCWCCMRGAVYGAERGEGCCEARRPLAVWVFSHVIKLFQLLNIAQYLQKIVIIGRLKTVIVTILIRLSVLFDPILDECCLHYIQHILHFLKMTW